MVVRDRVGRRRYIAFTTNGQRPSRTKLERELGGRWKLTAYEDGYGILRVGHTEVATARSALEAAGAQPIVTSGTIRGARRKAGLL